MQTLKMSKNWGVMHIKKRDFSYFPFPNLTYTKWLKASKPNTQSKYPQLPQNTMGIEKDFPLKKTHGKSRKEDHKIIWI